MSTDIGLTDNMVSITSGKGANDVNPALCEHYAGPFSRLDRVHFDLLYWVLFGGNILLLSFVSFWYSRTSERTKDLRSDDSKFRYLHLRCLYVSASCASVSVVMVVIEVYALLALQFCDGEDLMSLYWATWTMLQFGSVIAIFGIILHMALVLQGHDRPPWALALGTPVLVVAGLGNLVNSMLHRKGTKVMERTRSRSRANSKAGSLSMSQTPTIRDESVEALPRRASPQPQAATPLLQQAAFVGTAPDGGIIIQFSQSSPDLECRGRLLSRDNEGRVMVSFSRDKVMFADEQPQPQQQPPKAALVHQQMASEPSSSSSSPRRSNTRAAPNLPLMSDLNLGAPAAPPSSVAKP
ncbi:hypothetical protein MCOR27_001496 [Pyricularia oryzae]|uniref:Uncharacterized protein n=2 Tax=Pyricularia TaxID=48558 RepID=A0ABQ8NRK5_PYRGI|nr:hypothetical protein MCOR01_010565 [Pyricularia oryzae]KAI6301145.1 hypothetical protein MCOR33_003322 [Pyricularia grisea]KAI6262124.1 hypothetical protein MCOR19_001638 [Pyricularia oryzae]KAI6276622.1 hypothetical protein MCOR26_005526 [Pyricularia oryzae]KAI6287043.1 hypothetical protein MCOR27_001496 [Pyricularia oryzae]